MKAEFRKLNFRFRLLSFIAALPLLLLSCHVPVSVTNPLDTPTAVTAITISESRIDVSWNDIPQETDGFIVERCTEGTSSAEVWTEVSDEDVTLYSDTNLSSGTKYYYRVRAYNSVIKSHYSDVASATTLSAGTQTPNTPTELAVTSYTSSSITISWKDNSGNETGFRVSRAADIGGNPGTWSVITNPELPENTGIYTDNSGLEDATTYHYMVRACNGYGDSPDSNVISATTLLSIPDAPSGLTATAVSSSSISLSWTDNSDNETDFRIERANASGGPWSEIGTSTVITYINGGLNASTTYYYRVRSHNSAGYSNYAYSAGVTTGAGSASGAIIAEHQVARLSVLQLINDSAITNAKNRLHIAYGHTSHGSQITTGMTGLAGWKGPKYSYNNGGTDGALDLHDYAMGGDVGNYPGWVDNTRTYLGTPDPATGRGTGANADVNVIIWSWCGQVSSQTEQSMRTNYLEPMTKLEKDYPGIKFIYMTGHLDGGGLTGNLHIRNEQIRKYCRDNNKILFDFADIETYDPDGAYYGDKIPNDNCDYDSNGDGSRDKNWATDWQTGHTINVDWYNCDSAHSQALNANMKAYAFWWLMTRIAE